jgi:uncharacterized glyoxalase superfamily protein PhnB
MQLSFNLEYYGECGAAINFYSSIFNNTCANLKTFKEMPMSDAFGITEQGLGMVWQSMLPIKFGNSELRFEMSDSILFAMGKNLSLNQLLYNPIICLAHNDESYIRVLFEKLYGDQHSFEKLQDASFADKHGIKWIYEKSYNPGIFYCLSFDGFCGDVIAYYENAFQTKATEVIRYSDSPYAKQISTLGVDKIYSATLQFSHEKKIYALKLCDSVISAINGLYEYDPNALLFYQKIYNPVFTVRDSDKEYLSSSFSRLAIGAKLNKRMAPTNDGDLHGSMIDRYGICWEFFSKLGDSDDQ